MTVMPAPTTSDTVTCRVAAWADTLSRALTPGRPSFELVRRSLETMTTEAGTRATEALPVFDRLREADTAVMALPRDDRRRATYRHFMRRLEHHRDAVTRYATDGTADRLTPLVLFVALLEAATRLQDTTGTDALAELRAELVAVLRALTLEHHRDAGRHRCRQRTPQAITPGRTALERITTNTGPHAPPTRDRHLPETRGQT